MDVLRGEDGEDGLDSVGLDGLLEQGVAAQLHVLLVAGEGGHEFRLEEEVQGVAVSAQGQRNQALLQIDARHDGRGNPYFWLAFAKARFEPGNGSDLKAIADKRISVTPLRLDLTDEPTLTRFAQAFEA